MLYTRPMTDCLVTFLVKPNVIRPITGCLLTLPVKQNIRSPKTVRLVIFV